MPEMSAVKKLREIWRRLGFYFRRERFDRELDDEMRFHLAMKTRAKMLDGVQARDAQFDARRQFGNLTRLKERSREMWSFRWIDTTVKDLQYSLRMIRKSPVFATVVILSLALAIGANTAIFTLVDAVLLKTLPVKNPNELVLFGWAAKPHSKTTVIRHSGSSGTDPKTGMDIGSSLSPMMFDRMQQQNQTLTDLFAFAPLYNNLNVSIDNKAEIATAQLVSGGYYKGLGVSTVIGRTITEDDDKIGAPAVVVVSYNYWRDRFGSDPAILGKPAFINGLDCMIIGVSQPGFEGALGVSRTADLSIPVALLPTVSSRPTAANHQWLRVMGRLKPGATIEQTRLNLETAVQQAAIEGLREFLAIHPDPKLTDAIPPILTAIPGGKGEMFARRDSAKQLYILLVIVVLVLLIACINIANLLSARSGARQKEIAIRIALGAGRWRVIRQLLTESVALSIVGGLAGLALAYWTKSFLTSISLAGGDPLKVDMGLDLKVLGFTAGVSVVTGILFGFAPALNATRIDPGPALKENSSSQSSGRSWLSLGKTLILAQVALSIILLLGAGLFLRTLRNLQHVDYGFDAKNILIFDVNPSLNGYKGERLGNVYQQIADRMDTIPGAQSATISLYPLLKGWGYGMGAPKVPGAKKIPDRTIAYYMLPVRNNFLQTMRIPLLFGRGFDARDNPNSPKVAIVNQAFVKRVFDEDNPIGQHFQFEDREGLAVFEVVGIAKDTIYEDLRKEPEPIIYLPFQQQIKELDEMGEGMTYEIRSTGDPIALVPAVRDAVRSIDPKLPIMNVKTQTQQIDEIMSRERVFANLTGILGLLVLILAGLGLYGVMAYNVTRRTREIGIKMALGAGTRRVIGNVMRETTILVVIGIVFGCIGSFPATRLISTEWLGIDDSQSMLFGVTPHDPVTMVLAALFLLAVATIAGYLPARRAARVDPLVALRYD